MFKARYLSSKTGPQAYTSIILHILFSIFLLPFAAFAQETLTLQQAMEVALANNFEVRIAQEQAAMAGNNATIGNAGMLPDLGVEVGQQNSINNTRQEFLTGDVNERANAKSYNFNAAAQLNWTLFDGLAMFTTHQQLKKLEQQGEANVRLAMENTLADVVTTYYELVRLRKNIALAESTLELSNERLRLAEGKLAAGRESKVELLQAQVARNNDTAALMQLQQDLLNGINTMNMVLARPANTIFSVEEDSIELLPKLEYATLSDALSERNPDLTVNRMTQEIALLQLKTIRRQKWPVIDANVGYGYGNATSEAGFLAASQTYGLSYGIGARFNIFNGMDQRRREKNAQAEMRISQLQVEQLDLELNGSLLSTYGDYENALQLIALEEQNLAAATENVTLGVERYREGMLSGIEFREIQQSQLLAANRLSNLLYRAKVTEALLHRLSGDMGVFGR